MPDFQNLKKALLCQGEPAYVRCLKVRFTTTSRVGFWGDSIQSESNSGNEQRGDSRDRS
jgi:hypothetical protein